MTQIFNILASALSSTPAAIIPFIVTLALIGYLSYKIYQEFRKVYQKCNADKLELTNRIAKTEQELSLTDSKTIMLSAKLERIEESLERMNNTLIELTTTLRLMRESKTK
jgi:hypothetical protein